MSGRQDAQRNRVLPLSSILPLKGVGGPVSRGAEVAGPRGLRRPTGEGGGAKTPLLAFQDASGVQARSRARPRGGSELQGGARRKRRLPAGGPRRGRRQPGGRQRGVGAGGRAERCSRGRKEPLQRRVGPRPEGWGPGPVRGTEGRVVGRGLGRAAAVGL